MCIEYYNLIKSIDSNGKMTSNNFYLQSIYFNFVDDKDRLGGYMANIVSKPTTVRFDDDLKAQAVELLEGMGISFNGYLVMSVRQLVNQRKIPFEILPATDIPNRETRIAMLTAEAKELGLILDSSPAFDNADDFMNALDA